MRRGKSGSAMTEDEAWEIVQDYAHAVGTSIRIPLVADASVLPHPLSRIHEAFQISLKEFLRKNEIDPQDENVHKVLDALTTNIATLQWWVEIDLADKNSVRELNLSVAAQTLSDGYSADQQRILDKYDNKRKSTYLTDSIASQPDAQNRRTVIPKVVNGKHQF